MSIIEITSVTQFEALGQEWHDLCDKAALDSPFLVPEWFRCCHSAYGSGKKLFTLAVKGSDGLAGIAALWQGRDSIRGLPVERLSFVTCPDTPFVDVLTLQEKREEILNRLVAHLRSNSRWDVLTLERWPESSQNCRMFQDILAKTGMLYTTSINSSTPYIPIQGDWDSFLKTRSVKFRKTHRNIVNRIGKMAGVEVQCIRQDPTGSAMDATLTVSGKSWKHDQGIAITSREESRRFFSELTRIAGERGWLSLWLLRIDRIPMAMEYDLTYRGVTYALRADFDEDFKECSPGAFLEYKILKQHFDNGHVEYSAGPGLNQYKLHWTDLLRNNLAVQVYNNTPRGRLAWCLECKILPALRHLRSLAGRPRHGA